MMRWRPGSRSSGLSGLVLLLAGCALSAEQAPPTGARVCAEPRPEVCTMDYAPVCGLRRAAPRRSYGNACGACADPAVAAYLPGACAD